MPLATDPVLRCVAVPITARDIGAPLAELFALWTDARFAPVTDSDTRRPQLLVMVNDADADDLAEIRRLYAAHPLLARSFSGLTVKSADLKGDMDRYVRNPRGREGAFGARAGPNFLFFATMRAAEAFGGFALQVEVDCLPIQAGWIEKTQEVIDRHRGAWVIGSLFAGDGELKPETQFHTNGNALYRAGDPLFQAFAHEVWLPRLLGRIKEDHSLPYDCWWAFEQSRASALYRNEEWRLVQRFGHLIQVDPFVVNLLGKPTGAHDYVTVMQRIGQLGPPPVFFHGAAMTPLRSLLLDHPGDTMVEAIARLTGLPQRTPSRFGPMVANPPSAPVDDWLTRAEKHCDAITPQLAKALRRFAQEGSTD